MTAADRHHLHRSWAHRVDEDRVAAALAGEPTELTTAERHRAIELFVDVPGHSAAAAARGLGITRGAMTWHAYNLRKKRRARGDHTRAA